MSFHLDDSQAELVRRYETMRPRVHTLDTERGSSRVDDSQGVLDLDELHEGRMGRERGRQQVRSAPATVTISFLQTEAQPHSQQQTCSYDRRTFPDGLKVVSENLEGDGDTSQVQFRGRARGGRGEMSLTSTLLLLQGQP